MLQRQQWQQLEAVVAGLATDDLTRLLDGLCLTDDYGKSLTQYQKSGQSELRRLVAGVHATFLAWQARSGLYAKYLTSKQAGNFQSYLAQAADYLQRPFSSPAYQAEASARTVRVAMGLSEPELAREAFEQCTAQKPAHLQAHLFYFNVCTPKWFGSEDELEEFVSASPDSMRSLLEAMYLVELYREVSDGAEIVRQKFRNDNQRRIDQLLSQSEPLTDGALDSIYFNNYVAGLSHALNLPAERDKFLRALGPFITAYPWAYFGLSPQAVQQLAGRLA